MSALREDGGIKEIRPGTITFCVMSRCCSDEPGRLLAASVGCTVPADKLAHGYVSEHHAFGQTARQAGDYAEDLARLFTLLSHKR